MNEEAFWRLVDSSEGDDAEDRYSALVDRLAAMPMDEIHAFGFRWDEAHGAAYTWDLWAAAYLINGGCSDDGFHYFRSWLILQGSAVFHRAVADPDSLAEVTAGDVEIECYPALDAFRVVTGSDDTDDDTDAYEQSEAEALARLKLSFPTLDTDGTPDGEDWDFDDEAEARRRLPRLAERFLGDAGTRTEREPHPEDPTEGAGVLRQLFGLIEDRLPDGFLDDVKDKVMGPEDSPRQDAQAERAAELMRELLANAQRQFPDGVEVGTIALVAEVNGGRVFFECTDNRRWVPVGLFRTASAIAEGVFRRDLPPPGKSP